MVTLILTKDWSIQADKLSLWRDSNESRGLLPLVVHKRYIEHLPISSYRFTEENYIAIILIVELSPSPTSMFPKRFLKELELGCEFNEKLTIN